MTLLFDEEHEPELEEGVGLVVGAVTRELFVVRSVEAGLSLNHLYSGYRICPPARHRHQDTH